MTKRCSNILATGFFLATFALLCILLSGDAKYALAFREQQQLFVWDWHYVSGLLFQIGGFSMLIARFLVQFFHSTAVAAGITALLISAVPALAWTSLRKRSLPQLPLFLIPAALLAVGITDNYLHFDALIACMVALKGLWIYSRDGGLLRGCLITLAVWLLAGPAALLFALAALAAELNCKNLAYSVLALALCALTLISGSAPTFAEALTPAYFHEVTGKMHVLHTWAWTSIPVAIAASTCLMMLKKQLAQGAAASLIAAAAIACIASIKPLTSTQQRAIYHYEYLAEREDWPALERAAKSHMERYIDANYHNLALAQQGRLASDLFTVSQHTPLSLIYKTDDHTAGLYLARVLFCMGNVAAAQNIAFNALPSFCGFSPSMMKMVAQVDIMRGAYGVAEKYLSLLSKAPHYSAWAEQMRAVCAPDAALRSKEISLGAASLDVQEGFVLDKSTMDDLFRILDAHPDNPKTMEYGLCYLLLSKDMRRVYGFIDKYYGSPALQTLPVPAQEALVFFSDYYHSTSREYALSHGIDAAQYDAYQAVDTDYCRAHGVQEDVLARFAAFKEAYGRNGGSEPKGYKDTFWHYMLFVKI